MSRAAILLPWSAQAVDNPADPRVQILPTPISPGPKPAAQREPAGLCYAVNPDKKGLDIAVAAWAEAAPPTWPLYITGIEADTGLRFLRRRSLTPGENVVWLGRLTPDEHRKLSARVELCLGAARTDEYAAQQLEALVDGAIIVSVPSGGTIASVALARELNPALVATEVSAPGLAVCISRAIKMSELERTDYRARARVLMESHSRANFEHALAERVLPALLG
jgi:hypothetical protein